MFVHVVNYFEIVKNDHRLSQKRLIKTHGSASAVAGESIRCIDPNEKNLLNRIVWTE